MSLWIFGSLLLWAFGTLGLYGVCCLSDAEIADEPLGWLIVGPEPQTDPGLVYCLIVTSLLLQ